VENVGIYYQFFSKDYPPGVNLDSYSICAEIRSWRDRVFIPYFVAGPGIYGASISGAVDRGDISFSTHAATTLGVQTGGGLKVILNRNMLLVLDQRYHEVRFGKYLDGAKCYPDRVTGIGIEHKL
jgi:hypothetical protein